MRKFLTLCFFLIFLHACSGVEIERFEDAKPLPIPEGVKPHVIGLSNLKTLIPRGTNTAGFGPKGFDGLLACEFPWGPMQGVSIHDLTNTTQIRKRFADTLESLGYDVAGNPGLLFNEDEDYIRIRYRIGARVTDMALELCERNNSPIPSFYRDGGIRGEANLTVEWVIYDGLLKKTVYKTQTKGYSKLNVAMQEGPNIIMEDALASAIHNLGTDPKFHGLIFEGIEPLMDDAELGIDEEKLPPEDWSEPLNVAHANPFGKDLQKMQKATVLVESGAGGHGSGFFIADDLILTNAHVVGFADTLRVTLSGKSQSYLARLVRTDRPRDIAALRLEDLPPKRLYEIAPLNGVQPDLGQDVYVVGAPYYKKLQDTVTSGVVSGMRYDSKRRQTYIQADALIHGGNSGGPMFDEQGRVIGISVLGFINADGGDLPGLNWFIPIDDALEKLEIHY